MEKKKWWICLNMRFPYARFIGYGRHWCFPLHNFPLEFRIMLKLPYFTSSDNIWQNIFRHLPNEIGKHFNIFPSPKVLEILPKHCHAQIISDISITVYLCIFNSWPTLWIPKRLSEQDYSALFKIFLSNVRVFRRPLLSTCFTRSKDVMPFQTCHIFTTFLPYASDSIIHLSRTIFPNLMPLFTIKSTKDMNPTRISSTVLTQLTQQCWNCSHITDRISTRQSLTLQDIPRESNSVKFNTSSKRILCLLYREHSDFTSEKTILTLATSRQSFFVVRIIERHSCIV
jgi:hypothetical protein